MPTPGRLLDVGCGNGRLLWVAKQAGWQVKGLELSADMARYAAKIVGCEVVADDFLAVDPPPGDRESFDVVSLRHVLEQALGALHYQNRVASAALPAGSDAGPLL